MIKKIHVGPVEGENQFDVAASIVILTGIETFLLDRKSRTNGDPLRNVYVTGVRNDLAVDMSIACEVLGISQYDVLQKLYDYAILSDELLDNLHDRLVIIEGYLERWHKTDPIAFACNHSLWHHWAEVARKNGMESTIFDFDLDE